MSRGIQDIRSRNYIIGALPLWGRGLSSSHRVGGQSSFDLGAVQLLSRPGGGLHAALIKGAWVDAAM